MPEVWRYSDDEKAGISGAVNLLVSGVSALDLRRSWAVLQL